MGLFLFHVSSETGIEPAGPISMAPDSSNDPHYYFDYFSSGWLRSAFNHDYVYAATDDAIRAVLLADVSATPTVLSLE